MDFIRRDFIKAFLIGGAAALASLGMSPKAIADFVRGHGGGGGGGANLLSWDMENTLADGVAAGNWSDPNTGSFYNTAPAPLNGSYSIRAYQDADAGNKTYTSPTGLSYTAGATVYGFVSHMQIVAADVYSADIVQMINSIPNIIFRIRQNPDTSMRIYHGSVNTEWYPSWAVGTQYNFWWDYTPSTGGPNGTAHIYVTTGTTYTKPGSPAAQITAGMQLPMLTG